LRALPLLFAALASAASSAADADVLNAVNWARLRGCGGSGTHAPVTIAPLKGNVKLQKAAARLAGGAALPESLAALGYLAS
jgi:hypothetical protein